MSDENDRHDGTDRSISRRTFVKGVLGGAAALALPGVVVACGGGGEEAAPAPQPSQTAAGQTETEAAATAAAGEPKRGGSLRVGFIGGGTAQTLDPNNPNATVEGFRGEAIFDSLVELKDDFSLEYRLAESFEPNASADEWTVKVRSGVTWHDGSPFTINDVLYTLNRINDPDNALQGRNVTETIDFSRVETLDDLTVRLPLHQPNSEFPYFFWDPNWKIVKDGTTSFDSPIGTGPFKFVSWTIGQEVQTTRNDDYWDEGKPYVDEFQILEIPDQSARYNALLGGQIDMMESLSFTQAKEQQGANQIGVLVGDGPSIVPIYMAVTLEPFQDVRVRQAMRLIVDRPALIEAAQFGFGQVANDLYGPGLRFYNDQLPQREQDIEQAKSLLKAAGKEGLEVKLYTSDVAPGMVESATVFAQQAKEAGVNVQVSKGPADAYFGDKYLKQNFAQSLWFPEPLVTHYLKNQVKNANYPETHWDDPRTQKLFDEILRETDDAKKQDLFFEFQEILWNEGGYLIWGTFPTLDGAAQNVVTAPRRTGPLGKRFREVWLNS